jgi:hypothetical protein
MKFTSFSILGVCILFSACSEPEISEQLTPETHGGNETLSFLKDGSVWLAKIQYIDGETDDAFGEIVLPGTDSAFLTIRASGRINGKAKEYITFIFPRFKFKTSISTTVDSPQIDWSSGEISPAKFPTQDNTVLIGLNSDGAIRNGKGSVTITNLDSTDLHYAIVAGSFKFSVFNESTKDSIRCTSGRFDVRYGFH